jgi:hypothetical protein
MNDFLYRQKKVNKLEKWRMWLVLLLAACALLLLWRGLPLAYDLRVLGHVLYARLVLPRPLSWRDETVLSFRAWPDALDWNMHMNNSSDDQVCDYGRIAH